MCFLLYLIPSFWKFPFNLILFLYHLISHNLIFIDADYFLFSWNYEGLSKLFSFLFTRNTLLRCAQLLSFLPEFLCLPACLPSLFLITLEPPSLPLINPAPSSSSLFLLKFYIIPSLIYFTDLSMTQNMNNIPLRDTYIQVFLNARWGNLSGLASWHQYYVLGFVLPFFTSYLSAVWIFLLDQVCQTHFHWGLNQPCSCLQRAECNFRTV